MESVDSLPVSISPGSGDSIIDGVATRGTPPSDEHLDVGLGESADKGLTI